MASVSVLGKTVGPNRGGSSMKTRNKLLGLFVLEALNLALAIVLEAKL